MACPICGAKCRCRKRGEDGRCCSCHKHKSRTPEQGRAHEAFNQARRDAAIQDLLDDVIRDPMGVPDAITRSPGVGVQFRRGFTYPGLFGRPVVTDLVIITGVSRRVVIATEREDNPGASITNSIEMLARELMTETGWMRGDFVLVEHYSAGRYGGGSDLPRSLSVVSFERMWSGVSWKSIDEDALMHLVYDPVVTATA